MTLSAKLLRGQLLGQEPHGCGYVVNQQMSLAEGLRKAQQQGYSRVTLLPGEWEIRDDLDIPDGVDLCGFGQKASTIRCVESQLRLGTWSTLRRLRVLDGTPAGGTKVSHLGRMTGSFGVVEDVLFENCASALRADAVVCTARRIVVDSPTIQGITWFGSLGLISDVVVVSGGGTYDIYVNGVQNIISHCRASTIRYRAGFGNVEGLNVGAVTTF